MSTDTFASDIVRSSIIMLLYEKPLHGYGIMSSVRKRLGKDISPSLIYPFLHQMEKRGLVTATSKPVGRKPRKIYALTDEGKQLALRVFTRLSSLISIAIEPTLSVCAHCGAKLYESGHTEVIGGHETVFCCPHCFEAYQREQASLTALKR